MAGTIAAWSRSKQLGSSLDVMNRNDNTYWNNNEPHASALDVRRDFVAFERNAFVACQGSACAATDSGITLPQRDKSPSIAMGGLVILLVFSFVNRVQADVLAIEGRPMVAGVKIVELKKGQLSYRLPAGRVVSRPIEEVKFLQITGWSAFNKAEQLQRDEHLRQSASAYEKEWQELAITRTSDKLDRALLVRCRLLRVYDAQGRFDRAVKTYLDILERMPEVLDTLRPVKLPTAGSSFLPESMNNINIAINRHRGTALGLSLAKWRATWPGQKNDRKASADTTAQTKDEPESIQQLEYPLALIEALVAGDRFDEALTKIASLQTNEVGCLRADLYYWQGRSWLGKSQSEETVATQRDRRRAGLAFMRVVVHFPGHKLAPECLYQAGLICQHEGRKDLAQRLWSQLRRSYPGAGPFGQERRQLDIE